MANLVGLYFKQLTEGCGAGAGCCENETCRKFADVADGQKQAVAEAIVLAAHGPQALCMNVALATLETMVETAVCCHEAGVGEEAFDELCGHVKLLFSSAAGLPAQMAAAGGGADHLDVVLAASVFHQLSAAHECVAKAFASALKALMSRVRGTKEVALIAGLVCLAFDAMIEPNNFDFLVAVVCDEISRAEGKGEGGGAAGVVKLWARAGADNKRHVCQALQQYITLQYYTLEVDKSKSATDALYEHLRAPVVCLSVLHRANFGDSLVSTDSDDAKTGGGGGGGGSTPVGGGAGSTSATPGGGATALLAPPPDLAQDEFYNDVLNREMSLEADLQRWVEGQPSLCAFPCVLTAASKARILQADAAMQMRSVAQRAFMDRHGSPFLVIQVSRSNIVEDCLEQLAPRSAVDLKMKLKVKFKGEDGIDEGGVAKEFFQVTMGQLFDRTFAMFNYYQGDRVYWFNANTFEMPVKFELIGNLMGIALFNGVILNLHFPGALYKKLLGYPTTLQDLRDLMPDVATNLQHMLTYDEEQLEETDTSFEYNYEYYGAVKTEELRPGGSREKVTTANVAEYVALLTDYHLNKSVARQFNALKRGFLRVTDGADVKPLKLFTPFELERAICGAEIYDFYQLERTTRYEDGFDKNHRVIKNFWAVLHEMTLEQQKKLLMFATGSDRAPVEGLQGVNLVISRMGGDKKSLPTSHTCFNHLLLPEYTDKEALRSALLLAINHATGFGLR